MNYILCNFGLVKSNNVIYLNDVRNKSYCFRRVYEYNIIYYNISIYIDNNIMLGEIRHPIMQCKYCNRGSEYFHTHWDVIIILLTLCIRTTTTVGWADDKWEKHYDSSQYCARETRRRKSGDGVRLNRRCRWTVKLPGILHPLTIFRTLNWARRLSFNYSCRLHAAPAPAVIRRAELYWARVFRRWGGRPND